MNLTYDGQTFICPDGSDVWQDGYRDAMHHIAVKGHPFPLTDDESPEYGDGYTQAVTDVREWLALPLCAWFALCDHKAVGTIHHPALGDVPTCQRCADKPDMLPLKPYA